MSSSFIQSLLFEHYSMLMLAFSKSVASQSNQSCQRDCRLVLLACIYVIICLHNCCSEFPFLTNDLIFKNPCGTKNVFPFLLFLFSFVAFRQAHHIHFSTSFASKSDVIWYYAFSKEELNFILKYFWKTAAGLGQCQTSLCLIQWWQHVSCNNLHVSYVLRCLYLRGSSCHS